MTGVCPNKIYTLLHKIYTFPIRPDTDEACSIHFVLVLYRLVRGGRIRSVMAASLRRSEKTKNRAFCLRLIIKFQMGN